MKPLNNLRWNKLFSGTAGESSPAPASNKKADATDAQNSSVQTAPAGGHDTPHEAKPDQPKASSLTNRLFRTLKSAPHRHQPADIELSSFSPKF